jgi:hypothetical protein
MAHKPQKPAELASNFKFKGPTVIRATVNGTDLVFVPGEQYENLPDFDYVKSLVAQGFFEPVETKGKGEIKPDTLNP